MIIENCPAVCARAKWTADDYFFPDDPTKGQYNCPYAFGVTHQAAIIDGKVMCKHLRRKEAVDA